MHSTLSTPSTTSHQIQRSEQQSVSCFTMSYLEQLEQSSVLMEDATNRIMVEAVTEVTPPVTREKRKREGGKLLRSKVWEHFTRLEKKPGEREECRCNYCGQLYACSSRCGTTHLNRHIFYGGCSKYSKPCSGNESPVEVATPICFLSAAGFDSDARATPLRTDSRDDSSLKDTTPTQENTVNLEAQVTQLKDENRRLQQERDALASQKESLEQLLMTMAAETGRLSEENSKLKDDCSRLEEEKHKTVTREEFTRLEAQVSKLKEDFEKERRGFPAAAAAAIAQLRKSKS